MSLVTWKIEFRSSSLKLKESYDKTLAKRGTLSSFYDSRDVCQ
jgi:hypothetical protein